MELCALLSLAVEQLDVEVWFRGYKPPRPNEARENYPIIEVSYSPGTDRLWQLTMASIPRALRADVRTVLLPALPENVRSWLLARRPTGWDLRYHALRGNFSVVTQTLEFVEHDAA